MVQPVCLTISRKTVNPTLMAMDAQTEHVKRVIEQPVNIVKVRVNVTQEVSACFSNEI